jgi:hypothetical protein
MAERIEAISRETGWVASHAEVSDLVEKLAGTDLERRRDLIAKQIADGAGTIRLEIPREELTAIPLVRNRPVGEDTDVSFSLPRRSFTPYVIAAAVAAAGVGGFALIRTFGGNGGSVVASAPAKPEIQPAPPPPPQPTVEPAASTVEPAIAETKTGANIRETADAGARRPRTSKTTTHNGSTGKIATPEVGTPPPPSEEISKKNPYSPK